MRENEWCESYHTHPYDKLRECYHISVHDLFDAVPYPKVTDTMITYYLNSESFINTMDGNHNGSIETSETHAQRIASLILLTQKGILVHPITICYNDETKEVEIDDGWHRMRAFYFLNKNIAYRLVMN